MEMAENGGLCAPGNALPADHLSNPVPVSLNVPHNHSVLVCKA
ncbi:hypothetical protein PSE_0377 [Pseudovibrio sp. FO-BEG1]|nr:hypothetical protein PSE_0377 [Pseudovibrio sp. FO-BEG1]